MNVSYSGDPWTIVFNASLILVRINTIKSTTKDKV